MVLIPGTRENADLGVIHSTVGLMAFKVLVGIFEGSDGEDNDERKDDKTGGDGREFVVELEDGDDKEEAAKLSASGMQKAKRERKPSQTRLTGRELNAQGGSR